MSTGTATRQGQRQGPVDQVKQNHTVTIAGPRLAYHPAVEERFGVDKSAWTALVDAIFPTATTAESVILALSYCKARRLDPFKRVVHIVPIWSKAEGKMVDTVWPGIGELRTTAFRTGQYVGKDEAIFGPLITKDLGGVQVTFPEWCQVTVYRLVNGVRAPWVGPKVFWLETYATAKRDTDAPNEMWRNRVFGQIEKCAEAAALRAGFPEEIGGDYIPEEVERGDRPVLNVQGRVTKSEAIAGALGAQRGATTVASETSQQTEQSGDAGGHVEDAEPQIQKSPLEQLTDLIAKATAEDLPNLRGDVATDDRLSPADKTACEAAIKAREAELKKK